MKRLGRGACALALAALGCAPEVVAPREPSGASPPQAQPASARSASSALTIRVRSEAGRCGVGARPVVEGLDAHGQVVWVLDEHVGVALPLADGSVFAFGDDTSLRLRADGSVMWAHDWPVPQAAMQGAGRRVHGPDPRALRAIAERDGELFLAFAEPNESGFDLGLDVWTFAGDGALVRRRRVVWGDYTNFAFGTHAAIYAADEHSGRLDVLAPDGSLLETSALATEPAAPGAGLKVGFPSFVHTAGDLDVFDGADRLVARDASGRAVWSFGVAGTIAGTHAAAWGGVVALDTDCRLFALDETGALVWSRALGHAPGERCDRRVTARFASDASAVVVLFANDSGAGTAHGLSAAGVPLFRVPVDGAQRLVPVLADGRAELCGEKDMRPLPSLRESQPDAFVAEGPAPRVLEAAIEQLLDVPVDALGVLDATHAVALAAGHLYRFEGERFRDVGRVRAAVPSPVLEPKVNFGELTATGLAAGPDGALWIAAHRAGVYAELTYGPWPLAAGSLAALLRPEGNGFREVAALRDAWSASLGPEIGAADLHVLPLADGALVCQRDWCKRMKRNAVVPIALPSGWDTHDVAWIQGSEWLLGPELARVEHDALVGTGVKVELPAGYRPAPARFWGAAADDIWIVDEHVRHYDGKQALVQAVPLAKPRAVWGAAANDVWLAGEDGLAHYDGVAWEHVVGAGLPRLASATGVGTAAWFGGASGVFRATHSGPSRTLSAAEPPGAAREAVTVLVPPPVPAPKATRMILRAPGREPLAYAVEVAAAGSSLWLRDAAGVVAYDGAAPTAVIARESLGGWGCRQCLAPAATARTGVVLGRDAPFEITASGVRKLALRADRMLAVGLAPHATAVAAAPGSPPGAFLASSTVHIATGSARADEPPALAFDAASHAYGWEVPRACYVALDARGDETWLAGGLRCEDDGTPAPVPAGEGILVSRGPAGVRWIRAADGPLLDVVAVGPEEAWAVGVAGAIVHVKGATVSRFRLETRVRLHAVAAADGAGAGASAAAGVVWIGGDDATLLRADGARFERWSGMALPAGTPITSLAVRAGELWLASPDGVLRFGP